jgi:hypothetical protein
VDECGLSKLAPDPRCGLRRHPPDDDHLISRQLPFEALRGRPDSLEPAGAAGCAAQERIGGEGPGLGDWCAWRVTGPIWET